MLWQLALSVTIGSAWISAVAASISGTSGNFLEERSELVDAECTSPTNISVTCWYQLGIPAYLTQWAATHPTCTSANNETGCCISGEPWSTCFIRLTYAFDSPHYAVYGLNCTGFGSCQEPPLAPPLLPSLPSGITIQEFYVLNTIYAINALFSALNNWLRSVANAGQLVLELEQTGTLNTTKLSTAFSAGLPFLAYATFSPGIPQPPAGLTILQQFVLQTFLESLLAAPEVSTAIWVPSSPPSSNPPTTLSTNITLPSPSETLSTGLKLLLTSLSSFQDFTSSGSWSTTYPAASSLPNVTTPWLALANGAKTYAYSSVLNQNNFSAISLSIEEDQTLYQQGKACTTAGYVCTSTTNLAVTNTAAGPVSDDVSGENYTYYWSPVTHRQYQFIYNATQSLSNAESDPWTVLRAVETSGTSLPVLFDGAYTCIAEGRKGGEILVVEEDGSLDFSCFSELFVKF